jgi:hypothetical protein
MINRLGEKALESKLTVEVKKRGGRSIKLTNPNHIPDRLVLLPGAYVEFVELKSFGEVARPGQLAMHSILRAIGFKVYVIDRVEQIEEALQRWDNT